MENSDLKRQRKKPNQLDISKKVEIINFSSTHHDFTQQEIADKFSIDRSTISKILSKREEILALYKRSECRQQIRFKGGFFPYIDDAVYHWFLMVRKKNMTVTHKLLSIKALEFKDAYLKRIEEENELEKLSTFEASSGWVKNFKKRYGIKSRLLHGESEGIDSEKEQLAREELRKETSSYLPDNIFNADETGLFFRMMPSRTLALDTEHSFGSRKDKERVTILIVTNSTGTYKKQLTVIGKSKNPKCFAGINHMNLPVTYRSGPNSWMNTDHFKEFLVEFNNQMKKENRGVLLLLDNACPHLNAANSLVLSHLRIKFITPNMTNVLQPLDCGIIKSLKSQYRRLLLKKVEERHNESSPYKISLKEALFLIKNAWDNVSVATIKNCWNHADISLTQIISDEQNEYEQKKFIEEQMEISCLISMQVVDDPLKVEEYLEIDNCDVIGSSDISEIADFVLDESGLSNNDVKLEESDSEEEIIQLMSLNEGLKYLERSVIFMEQQDIAEQEELSTLRELLRKTKIKMENSQFMVQGRISDNFNRFS